MTEYFKWSAVETLDILGREPSMPMIWPIPTEMPPGVNLVAPFAAILLVGLCEVAIRLDWRS